MHKKLENELIMNAQNKIHKRDATFIQKHISKSLSWNDFLVSCLVCLKIQTLKGLRVLGERKKKLTRIER